jgi:signal recognition particle subunit SEC65
MKDIITDIDSLHSLIEKYFDGETSLDEERSLRRTLAVTSLQSDKIDEAKAVLGFFAAQRKSARPKQRKLHYWAAAATIALLVASSVSILHLVNKDTTSYTCYIAGNYSDSKEDSFAIMQDQLSDINDARTEVYNDIDDQLGDIFEITNL